MSRTITALFDSRSDAEAARARLTAANIDADNVRIVDQESGSGMGNTGTSMGGAGSTTGLGTVGSSGGSTDTGGHGGIWGSIKHMFLPDEDRHSYEEGVRRGGVLLYATVDEDDTDRAIDLLDDTGSVDMDEREQSWRSEGWAGYTPSTTAGSTGMSGMDATGSAGTGRSSSAFMDDKSDATYAATTANTNNVEEERIQLAAEELRVGKREVNRGGARIRSYVVETPVSEQVNLREEHVHIDRHPMTGDATNIDKGALFQERTIEMTETAEEAVVSKEARVTEELVVSKTADQRTETISDTVRRTEVDIDEDMDDRSKTGMGSSGSGGMGGGIDRNRT